MFKLAGAETMCENLCLALQKQGCEVLAVSLYSEHTSITRHLESAGIKVIYLNKKKGPDVSIFVKLYRLIKEEKPTVVHTHIYAARYALPVAAFCGVPVKVHTVHNIAQKEQAPVGKVINKFMFRYCGVIPVALSKEVRRTVEEVYGIAEDKIPVIFNGIDLSKCKKKEDYSKKKYFKILHIGRFMDVKNHRLILECFSEFVQQHVDARLQLIGDGELKKKMEELAKELHIENVVEFLGLQSNVYPWLHDADLFILPSKFEGMPMTLIEAMGTGLPIIASSVGGVPDMLKNGDNAILINPNLNALLVSLNELYSDEKERRRIGKNARERSNYFSAYQMAQAYIQIY